MSRSRWVAIFLVTLAVLLVFSQVNLFGPIE
jgi:HAMP domain-containing protein